MANPIRISDARKNLSRLVERVARGAGPIVIGRYGRERALLISAAEYVRLKKPPIGTRRKKTLVGTVSLNCNPQELIGESRKLGDFWLASFDSPSPKSPSRGRRKR